MDPSILITTILLPLVKKLVGLIFCACKSSSTSAALREELERFHTRLLRTLLHWEDKSFYFAPAGFTPKALENLRWEMQEFVSTAEDLFERRRLKKEDVQKFREEVMTAFQWGMTCALLEVQDKILMELNARLEPKAPTVQIILITEKAMGNPKLQEVLHFVLNTPHPTEAFKENLKNVLPSNVVPTSAAASTSKAHSLCKFGEEQDEGTSVEQYWKEKLETMEPAKKKEQGKEDNIKNNPNLSMSFINNVPGKGQLRSSKRDHDHKIEVTFEGPPKAVRAMMGTRPMKVSAKLGYFYFEVEVMEMAELFGTSKICAHSGVGVGLATCEEFRNDKMVGWYQGSFGYDGRIGKVYCNKSPQEPFEIGILTQGDALGIGLLQLPNQRPAIFFVKNGNLQGCTQEHYLRQSSTHLLHPVISLASQYVKVCVNFHGPFDLPSGLDLAAILGIT